MTVTDWFWTVAGIAPIAATLIVFGWLWRWKC